jgi:hypothetical protein
MQNTLFRYAVDYVDNGILQHCQSDKSTSTWIFNLGAGSDALIVYAECPTTPDGQFTYVPLRFGRVIRVRSVGSIVYVDVELGGFPDLTDWKDFKGVRGFHKWMSERASPIIPKPADPPSQLPLPGAGASIDEATIDGSHAFSGKCDLAIFGPVRGEIPNPVGSVTVQFDGMLTSPLGRRVEALVTGIKATKTPKQKIRGVGLFFFLCEGWELKGSLVHSEDQCWESVIDQLAPLASMEAVLFYRVKGFFSAKQSILQRCFGEWSSVQCPIKNKLGQNVFQLEMGKPVDLRVAFYRPRNAVPPVLAAEFTVECSDDAFSKIPDNRIQLQSRYDEVDVRLVTKRIFDNVLAPVSIRLAIDQPKNIAAEPLLLTKVLVPAWVIPALLPALLLVPILLSLGDADVKGLLEIFFGIDCETKPIFYHCAKAATYVWVAKAIGALVGAFVGVVVFHRLPTKGT